MVRVQSYLLSLISIILIVVIHHPTRCNPIRSLKSTSNTLEIRTLPSGAHYIPNPNILNPSFSNIRTIITPDALAASVLARFYLSVAARAIFEANAGSPEADNLFYTEGPLALIFVADRLGKAIPWGFVANFALSMVNWTNRGFLGTYDRGYWNIERTLGVYAGLRIEGMGPYW